MKEAASSCTSIIDEIGDDEMGQTFDGVLSYVVNHSPHGIILETITGNCGVRTDL